MTEKLSQEHGSKNNCSIIDRSEHVSIDMHVCVCVCVCIYIYIYLNLKDSLVLILGYLQNIYYRLEWWLQSTEGGDWAKRRDLLFLSSKDELSQDKGKGKK